MTDVESRAAVSSRRLYNTSLLFVAGLGGLLYGIDIGIIGGALPYLEATSSLNAGQLSVIVAAVLLGSVISTLFAGLLADRVGRRLMMIMSGTIFAISIPIIALSHGYGPLFTGRLLQGISGGFIGVVVPLYLAECLTSSTRGRGTGIFQWLLTLGIVVAALIGMFYSYRINALTQVAGAAALFAAKDQAWRNIFWISLPPGIFFVIGSLLVTESPRWLHRQGKRELAFAALLRSRNAEMATREMNEMEATAPAHRQRGSGERSRETLLQRKYVLPFLLACLILFCNTATGVNSIIGYNTGILLQSGLTDLGAHWGYVIFTLVNFLMTLVGLSLVDRVGRRLLLMTGTAGLIICVTLIALLFRQTEQQSVDCRQAVQAWSGSGGQVVLHFDTAAAERLLSTSGYDTRTIEGKPSALVIIYSYGGFSAATTFVRSDYAGGSSIQLKRDGCIPSNRVEAFFRNPFADLAAARIAPLKIDRALVSPVPDRRHGWLVALGLYGFIAFFAIGPGVCVWLALSELMPTRIRSVGMSIALVINQSVSTILAVLFLPFVSKYGYSTLFFTFGGFTVVYFLTALFLLPETKGKTLEEIGELFITHKVT